MMSSYVGTSRGQPLCQETLLKVLPISVQSSPFTRFSETVICARVLARRLGRFVKIDEHTSRPSGRDDVRTRFRVGQNSDQPSEGYSVSVEEKVIGIVSEQLGVAKEEIKLESKFVDDLKADSLDVVELVMEFEDEFEVTIPDDDYDKIKTVGDAVNYITEKKNAA
jgi:acyl carrier protein